MLKTAKSAKFIADVAPLHQRFIFCPNSHIATVVPVRVLRLFSAVGKNAKKSRRRELQMRYPETSPRPGVAAAFTRSTGVSHTFPITFLCGKFLHPLSIMVPLQVETTLSKKQPSPIKVQLLDKADNAQRTFEK